MDNNFKNVIDVTENNHSSNFKNRVVVPFFSGIIGCSLVIGTCFGVPQIKEKILGNTITTSTSTQNNSSSMTDTNAGTIDFVSLNSYSDTAVFASTCSMPYCCPWRHLIPEPFPVPCRPPRRRLQARR